MKRLLDYLVLPSDISDFERRYLGRTTRIAIIWGFLQVPIVMLVAYLCGTGVLRAGLYASFVAAGPLLASRVLSNPRAVARVVGVAAMCLAAVLVHFGQGPNQIEMHFAFFVSIALLAVFADPLVIVAAAATAAAHHLVFWLAFPSSVFNHEASVWTVAIHALFVVIESVAACFVARSFFDNVIGLDRIVAARTNEVAERNERIRLVLDNVEQGLVAIDLHGRLSDEHSGALGKLLAKPKSGEHLWDWLGRVDPRVGSTTEIFWTMLVESTLPPALAIEQLPDRIGRGGRTLSLSYQLLGTEENPSGVLLVVSDLTPAIARERVEADQRESMLLFDRARSDRSGLLDFIAEGKVLIEEATKPEADTESVMRAIHTLKGCSGLSGATSMASLCHDVESRVEETGELLSADRLALKTRWSHVHQKIVSMTGERATDTIEVHAAVYRAVLDDLRRTQADPRIVEHIESWRFESTAAPLKRLAEHATALGRRLGKADIDVVTDHGGVRIEPRKLRSVWAALMHVIRNAVDHGIETSAERVAAGKPSQAKLALTTRLEGSRLTITVVDDGAGIDWEAVAEKARARGLAAETPADLERALFEDGLSTRDEATDSSGRGVGMSALLEEAKKNGGDVRVTSQKGRGTTVAIDIIVGATKPPLALARTRQAS